MQDMLLFDAQVWHLKMDPSAAWQRQLPVNCCMMWHSSSIWLLGLSPTQSAVIMLPCGEPGTIEGLCRMLRKDAECSSSAAGQSSACTCHFVPVTLPTSVDPRPSTASRFRDLKHQDLGRCVASGPSTGHMGIMRLCMFT